MEELTQLDNYHDMVYIHCHNNKLTVLPTLPNSLKELYCSHNELTTLPSLPNSLKHLDCSENKLTELQNLPKGLTHLICSDNLLFILPNLPNCLTHLNCYKNNLTFLPVLPKSLIIEYYHNNPVALYINDNCGGDMDIYHRENEIFANKLVMWYLDCRENSVYKFCRTRLNKEYDALREEDTGGIMGLF